MSDPNTELNYDLLLFNKLEGLENALLVSVLDPINIPSDVPILPNAPYGGNNSEGVRYRGGYSNYCYYLEKHGKAIVLDRIANHGDTIKEFVESYRIFLSLFYEIESHAQNADRKGVVDKVDRLCTLLTQHADLLSKHQSKLGEKSFLYFPGRGPGHYAFRAECVFDITFNNGQTKTGMMHEISYLNEFAVQFGVRTGKPEFYKIQTSRGPETPEFNLYNRHLGMVVKHLRKLGLDIPEIKSK